MDDPSARRPALPNDRRYAVPLSVIEGRRLGILPARAVLVPRVPRKAVLVVLPHRSAITPAAVNQLPLAAAAHEGPKRVRPVDPTPRFDHHDSSFGRRKADFWKFLTVSHKLKTWPTSTNADRTAMTATMSVVNAANVAGVVLVAVMAMTVMTVATAERATTDRQGRRAQQVEAPAVRDRLDPQDLRAAKA